MVFRTNISITFTYVLIKNDPSYKDMEDINTDEHPVILAEVKYLLESIKTRISTDNRSSSYKIYKQTLNYVEKVCRISEKSLADDLRSSLFVLGCTEMEIASLGALSLQSIYEIKALVPSLADKDESTLERIVQVISRYQ